MNINDWKISTKLTAAFGAVVATIGALGAVVYLELAQLEHTSGAILEGQSVLDTVDRIEKTIVTQESNTRAFLVFQNQKYLDRIATARESYNAQIETLKEQLAAADGSKSQLAALETAAQKYFEDIVDHETKLAQDSATREQAVEIVRSGLAGKLMEGVDAALQAIRNAQQERLDTAMDQDAAASSAAMLAIFIGVAVAALLAALSGWWLAQNTSKLISRVSSAMRKLADGDNKVDIPCIGRKDEMGDMADAVMTFKKNAIEKVALEAAKAKEAAEDTAAINALAEGLAALASGNLTHRIEASFGQKTQQLKDDFNTAIGQMDEAMSVISGNASGIRSGAGEVSHAADDLSRRTEQQAANLEETAAALDQITATVKKTAQSAISANTVVTNARSEAEQSGRVVRSAVEAMHEIEGSSRQIGQIIGVIDEIAFQTNLLALNAGVEAARAGEAGRGFAVVASEVRALAQRSADAAKEIKALITASSGQVENGVSLVGQAGETLQRIVAQVSQISTLVSEIAASAQEQSVGLNQVNTAVNQMDQVTQQNAAMVEQSTAASRSLAQESVELSSLVGRFKVTNAVVVPMAVRSEAIAERKKRAPAIPQMKPTSQAKVLPAAEEASWEEF